MPILSKEPDLYPENLLDADMPDPSGSQWFAMYTLARQEKELMRKLRTQNISHYGPMISQRKRSPQGRIRTSYIPLFTGYVFVCGTEEHRFKAVSTGCVSRCLSVQDHGLLYADLRRIRLMTECGSDARPEPKPVLGRQAVIRTGAMKGIRGTVTQVNGQHRLTVLVQFMQQGASVIIDQADLDLLD